MDTLKQEEDEDQTIAVLPPDSKARVMGSVTNQVGKAWDTALATMWDLQKNLPESLSKKQMITLLV